MTLLAGKTVSSAVRPPYPYGVELISQFLLSLRLVWFPLLMTTVAICYRASGLQASNFLVLFGALDRLGGVFVLAAIREIGPLITSIVVAGVASTAITADLGARKVREELDTNVLDAHDLTIATGAIGWIVEVSGPSSSGRR